MIHYSSVGNLLIFFFLSKEKNTHVRICFVSGGVYDEYLSILYKRCAN